MDLEPIVPWLSLAALAIAVGTSIANFFTSGSKSNALKLTEHDRRIQSLEDEMKHMPDKDSVVELKLAIAELKGTVGTLGESVGSISRTVHRIDDYLRQDKK